LLFENLNIILPIQRSLKDEGYTEATPIQAKTILPLLEGKDLLGCAQTGTGKTAAFAIPILQGLNTEPKTSTGNRQIKALVLAPTRELAIQIHESFETYGRYLSLKSIAIYGGVSQKAQTNSLSRGVDILVATPGRLLDLINQKYISLANIKFFVLDEADQMLDMGMIFDVRRIIAYLPKVRQTMFFSATMPDEIDKLSASILNNPIKVAVTPVASTVESIKQEIYYVNKNQKINLLIQLLRNPEIESALVFSRTKHGADKIVKSLSVVGYQAAAIHGNKSQNARQLALGNFKAKKTRILVATDIAARGIDIDELSHVIIYDLPEVPEAYVHRIGRTGRAGLGGTAISFCDQDDKLLLRDIQKLIKINIPVIEGHPFPITDAPTDPKDKAALKQQRMASRGKRPTSQADTKRDNTVTTARANVAQSSAPKAAASSSKRRDPKPFQGDSAKRSSSESSVKNNWQKKDNGRNYRSDKNS